MSEALEKGYIKKKNNGEGEYEDLHLEGIELLQKLSGAIWTDYNEHDPGVTILENLIYAVTDLSYKTTLSIEDILTGSKGSFLKSGDNGFFIPSEIFTTNPVTENDLRKIIIDRITNVKNVWVKPCFQLNNGVSGLYHVAVETRDYPSDPTDLIKETERIKNEIHILYNEHRSLCENLYSVSILKPFELKIKLALTLNHKANGEEVFAHIFYIINNYLSHSVRFYSLWELQNNGESLDTIFNGPLLENGFIPDRELSNQVRKIVPSEILKRIAKVPGVISVDLFDIATNSDNSSAKEEIDNDEILVPEDCTPILLFPKSNKYLMFKNEDVHFYPDLSEVEKQLAYIEAVNLGSFKTVSKSMNRIEIPKGQSLNISSYFSVREQFPNYYGIGKFGLPSGLPQQRYIQSEQLKAYLLPFEQLMTNFLAQLDNIYTLYNIGNASNPQGLKSYFYQELEDMPSLLKLIEEDELDSKEYTLNNWKKSLQQLNRRQDKNKLVRLNQIADNLLARFSEKFPTYSLQKINTNNYGEKLSNSEFQREALVAKKKLIDDYARISYNRGKAFNYFQKKSAIDFVTKGIEDNITPSIIEKVAILLGIEDFSLRPLTKVIADSGIKIYQKKKGMEVISEKLEIIYSKDNIDVIAVDDIVIVDETVENLRGAFYYIGNSGNILEDVLKNGVLLENYEIRQTEGAKQDSYYVVYTKQKGKPTVVHISDSENEAIEAINYSIDYLVDLNKQSEGIYLIEHLFLSPPYQGAHFGFDFFVRLGENETILFKEVKKTSLEERNNTVAILAEKINMSDGIHFGVTPLHDRYYISIFSEKGEILAHSSIVFKEKEEAQKYLDKIQDTKPDINIDVTYYAYYGNNKIDEEFFSFQMSFIMPAWPVRFQDTNFRIKFNNIVSEEAPAHVAHNSIWLNLVELMHFEKIFYEWFELISENKDTERQMELSYDLITIIQKYTVRNNPENDK